MALFGKKSVAVQPARPASRTIPILEPDYFESIHDRLFARGGSLDSTTIAAGVSNAIFNTPALTGWNASEAVVLSEISRRFMMGVRNQIERSLIA